MVCDDEFSAGLDNPKQKIDTDLVKLSGYLVFNQSIKQNKYIEQNGDRSVKSLIFTEKSDRFSAI